MEMLVLLGISILYIYAYTLKAAARAFPHRLSITVALQDEPPWHEAILFGLHVSSHAFSLVCPLPRRFVLQFICKSYLYITYLLFHIIDRQLKEYCRSYILKNIVGNLLYPYDSGMTCFCSVQIKW